MLDLAKKKLKIIKIVSLLLYVNIRVLAAKEIVTLT
jgi:hypothetical protein